MKINPAQRVQKTPLVTEPKLLRYSATPLRNSALYTRREIVLPSRGVSRERLKTVKRWWWQDLF